MPIVSAAKVTAPTGISTTCKSYHGYFSYIFKRNILPTNGLKVALTSVELVVDTVWALWCLRPVLTVGRGGVVAAASSGDL